MIDDFLSSGGYSPSTKVKYFRVLTDLVALSDLDRLSAAGLLAFVERAGWGNSQRYVSLGACRKYLQWRYGSAHPALCARIKRTRPKRQRVLTVQRALDLLASFDRSTVKGLRDLAICALALDTGLRLAELCRLRVGDVDLRDRTLQVIVKGGQWGIGVFSDQTAAYISDWISVRQGDASALFVSVKCWRPLTNDGLQTIIKKWGIVAGFKLSPHDLRRTFATLSTIFGAPSRVVQSAGRWSDIAMVEYYTASITAEEIRPYLPVQKLKRD